MRNEPSLSRCCIASRVSLLVLLVCVRAVAQPAIISIVPANMATDVPVNASVVFTFNTAMNTAMTGATFFDITTFQILPTAQAWSGGNTVLTCTPGSPWPLDHTITWSMTGRSAGGTLLGGTTAGTFTTGVPTGSSPLVLTNYGTFAGNGFAFDVTCETGQQLVAEYRPSLASGNWLALATTNTATSLVRFQHPNAMTNANCFYRVRTGP